ncbi:MAG: phosphomannomutase [Pseudomonadota bacterium]
MKLSCFKAYDVRGVVPDTLNEDIAYRIGRAFAEVIGASSVIVGYDVRLSSPSLTNALASGLMDAGADVYDIGLCGTEEMYFATAHFDMDGGIMITASHNPMDYNGMKFVREGARPISGDSGLSEVHDRAASGNFTHQTERGVRHSINGRPPYIAHILSYVDAANLRPLKIAMDAGNGGAGLVAAEIARHLPIEIVPVHFEPDGSFPNGIPNPLLPENRSACIEAVCSSGADMGVAWDGDFDRCFLFDEQGNFIEGYYIVGLLAEAFLRKHPGEKIVHDPRLTWNTIDLVNKAGGVAVQSKTGHAFIKERMRFENAIYGGEMSAHHYFRDFAYCDSGMIPWLLVSELLSVSGKPLSALVGERMHAYPCSGEINFHVTDPQASIDTVMKRYADSAINTDRTDGISLEFADWRLNVRASNTEPVLRLNVESRGVESLMHEKTSALTGLLSE